MTREVTRDDLQKITRAMNIFQSAGLKHKLSMFDTTFGAIALAITLLALNSESADELNDGRKALEEWFQHCIKKMMTKRQNELKEHTP
jgi:hypothetical protein